MNRQDEGLLLTPVDIAGICGKFSRPENSKQGLHLLAEMAAQAQLDKATEPLKQEGAREVMSDIELVFPWIKQGVNEKPWQALKEKYPRLKEAKK